MSAKELNIGDYVRTKGGLIGKVIEIKGNYKTYFIPNRQENDVIEIIKSSPNIIDFIQVGDILKFKDMKHYQEVLAIDNEKLYLTDYIYMSGLQEYKNEMEEDLEWVITHEQIEQMAYKIGE